MLIRCPDCGAEGQEVGKFCENCGRLLSESDVGATASNPPTGPTAPVPDPAIGDTGAQPATTTTGATTLPTPSPQATVSEGAQFAVVRANGADPTLGFAIQQPGEFLVGRPNAETGAKPDIDVRQWVEPIEVGGQKQYLIHRRQCYLGLLADGSATIRACEGSELDTLVKPVGQSAFVPLQGFATVRAALPSPAGTYPLEVGDQIYMGDPEAVRYFQSGDPTARESYLVLELLGKGRP